MASLLSARTMGKREEYNKLVGGFAIALMTHGNYDWFPVGQPPNVDGLVDRGAQIVEKWSWNGSSWKDITGRKKGIA